MSEFSHEELAEELEQMQLYIEDLEEEVLRLQAEVRREKQAGLRIPRNRVSVPVDVSREAISLSGNTVNLSTGGACVELNSNLTFDLKVEFGDELHDCPADLVWMRKLDGDRVRMGFHFSNPESVPFPKQMGTPKL